ncbi:MAG TPA: ATP synthase F1 subunit gamma [Planctomycetota bacterium]|nr:ATP synthase F1 subunit gamma [Planctomycetota bacterium]
MGSLRDIRRRIASVESTQKITSAMKMVSAAKLRRGEEAIRAARPYADRMRSTLAEVARSGAEATHPLLERRADKKALEVVVITSDRGLAGAFNSNVIKMAEGLIRARQPEVAKVQLTALGKKGADFFRRRRSGQLALAQPVGAQIHYAGAQEVARRLMNRFLAGEIDEVVMVYSEFVSKMTQRPRVVPLLPCTPAAAGAAADVDAEPLPYEIEPSAAKLLGVLVPKAVEVEVFRALLENQAGEHAARMAAMESATRNTEDLIEKLTLEYNRARQAAITKELVEIVTGAQALE